MREDISRLEQWQGELDKAIKLYHRYTNATKNLIEVNIGHDDQEVIRGFDELVNLFGEQRISKSFIVTDFGAIERYIISSLQNIDEQVMAKTCEVILALVKGPRGTGSHEEGA